MTAKTDLLHELQHTVPILGELPIATILRNRQQEKDAFEAYRDAVTEMSSPILTVKTRWPLCASAGSRHRATGAHPRSPVRESDPQPTAFLCNRVAITRGMLFAKSSESS
jgi:hypothetical protein